MEDDFIPDDNPQDDFQPDPSNLQGKIDHPETLLNRALNNVKQIPQGFADVETLGLNRLAGYMGEQVANKIVSPTPKSSKMADEMLNPKGGDIGHAIGASIPIAKIGTELGGLGIKALFGKQMARKALPKASKELSESVQEVFKKSASNPTKLSALKKDFIDILQKGLDSTQNPKGPQATAFNDWIDILNKHPSPNIDANMIDEIETAFGHVAKFGRDPGANPRLVQAAKDVNRFASSKLDEVAKNAGVPEFIARSAKKSSLLKAARGKPSFIGKLAGRALEGGAMAAGGKTVYDILRHVKD